MWSFFCETHRQELVTTLERFVHPHTMRGPVNGYLRPNIYSVDVIKRVSIIVSDNVPSVFFSALMAGLPQSLWIFFMWSV